MIETIKKLLRFFNKKDKKKLFVLLLMMVVAAVLETIGIGLIVPFIGMVTNPEYIQEQSFLSYLYEKYEFQSTQIFSVFAVILLLGIFLTKNVYLLLFNYVQYRVILNQQIVLSKKLFNAYLTKPYIYHLEHNSATLIRNVNGEVGKIFQGIILPGFQLITEGLVIAFITIMLIMIEPVATITAFTLLGGGVFIFFRIFKRKISDLGKEQQKVGGALIKWVKQGLGASKEVKVSGKESFFVQAYAKQSQIMVKNNRYLKMLETAPRLFIETLLVSIILFSMLIIIFKGISASQLVSTMALFAMAAFRVMPSINRVIGLLTSIKYNQPALSIVYEDLFTNKDYADCTKKEDYSNSILKNIGMHQFKKSIKLENVSFRYPQQKELTIKDVSLTIPIGQSVAFIGESGAGKSTIVDIILGLYQPEKGKVLIDGINLKEQKRIWQREIGYVPQTIFLLDDTIRANVALGVNYDQIEDDEVWRALEQAQLKEFVESLPNKLDTSVGERGVKLSGGQRQRIGIARALYHNPQILFMDEATSALDNETEKEIMRAIDGLKGEKTLIIIAHRLTTIENCDIVFNMNRGKLLSIDNKLEQSS
jgi:ATP-binding cassette, subfamily B, bacterial PglK